MKMLRALQDRFGFTRKEVRAILLLTGTLLLGSAVKWFRASESTVAPEFDYTAHDSEFVSLSAGVPDSSAGMTRVPQARAGSRHETPPAAGSIDLNSASKAELVRLPGIGPSYAERILEHRQRLGRFHSVHQLEQVKGIGKRRLEKIRPFLRITKE
jgi:competence ComEA-like helix-hairpin-helix protein